MSTPHIADNKPKVLELATGTYHWCACGQSKNQPYCDGSHKGSEFTPKAFTLAETKKVALCMCKQSKNPPFCDGTHSKL